LRTAQEGPIGLWVKRLSHKLNKLYGSGTNQRWRRELQQKDVQRYEIRGGGGGGGELVKKKHEVWAFTQAGWQVSSVQIVLGEWGKSKEIRISPPDRGVKEEDKVI